jgi:glycosyltransferase involved in cell wall biosynthesis
MDDPRITRLERELDYATNQARMLRDRLQGAIPQVASSKPKSRLHGVLDAIQSVTPDFLRAAVRSFYLKYFYYRVFPENSPRAVLWMSDPPLDPRVAHSGYAPFVEFKRQLCRNLSMDFGGLSTNCEPGLVSVVLPVYNGAAFVAEAIASALAQSHTRFELIIVDDGSTDGTPAIIARYSDHPRVRLLRQENRKLPGALNTGFAAARGEFFTWISHDNRMHPDMLAELVAFLQSHADVEMVYADEQLIDEHGAPSLNSDFCKIYQSPEASNVLHRPRDPGELNLIQNNFIGGCFLYRSWTAHLVGDYSEDCFGFEDYDYWMRMNALFRIAHLGKPDILHSYRLHRHSLTAREKELRISDRARYFTSVEAERRKFFTDGFDIQFTGTHPWFASLAQAYRRSGHNVMDTAQNAFPKSITIGDGGFAVVRENSVQVVGVELHALNAPSLEYALLAAANAWLWNRRGTPRISLVVCTYNRADILPRCLQAARSQTLDASEYEIIVVDNASTDSTRAIVEQWPEIRYLYCPYRGLSQARNTGGHAARAPIVTYIDDDAIAESDLLEKILATFAEHPDAGCVGGRIDIHLPPELPAWYSQHFAGYYSEFNPGYADVQRVAEMWEYPFGANVSYKREVLDRVGFFNLNMGRVGRNTSGGEELDAEYRIAKAGYGIYYTPHARVEHIIKPDRLNWSHIANSARAAGRNWAYYELELMHHKWTIRGDLRMLIGTVARMINRENFHVAHSQNIFYRAKILRKLRYVTARP